MTVGALIRELEKFPEDMLVEFCSYISSHELFEKKIGRFNSIHGEIICFEVTKEIEMVGLGSSDIRENNVVIS